MAGPVGAAWPRGTRLVVDLKQDGIEVIAQPKAAAAVGQAPGERAEDLLEAVSLFDRFRFRGDDDVTQLVNPGVGRKRKPHVAVDAKVAEFLPPRLRVVNLDELQIGAVLPGGRMVHDLGDDQRRAAARRAGFFSLGGVCA